MAQIGKILLSDEFINKVCAALGVEPYRIGRIIIDAKAGEPVRVYMEAIGDDRLLKLDWHGAVTEAAITWEEAK